MRPGCFLLKNQSFPQIKLYKFVLRLAVLQFVVLYVLSGATALWIEPAKLNVFSLWYKLGDCMQAKALFTGGLCGVVPFLLFALILISGGFISKTKIAVHFFIGVTFKFILSAGMLWIGYFYLKLPILWLLAGFMLAYFILLCLPKRRWLHFGPSSISQEPAR